MQEYTAQLAAKQSATTKETVKSSEPASPTTEPVPPTSEPYEYDVHTSIEAPPLTPQEKAEMRRNTAREAAVLVKGLQHQKDMMDTYIEAVSDDESDTGGSVSPGAVYQETLEYHRRKDLVNAFEQVAAQTADEQKISLLA
jgi:hypothetical protein